MPSETRRRRYTDRDCVVWRQLPPEAHILLDLQAPLGADCLQVQQRHPGVSVSQLVLERLRVPVLLQPCDGAAMPQHMDRTDSGQLLDTRLLERPLNDLVDPYPGHGEKTARLWATPSGRRKLGALPPARR